MVIWYKSVSIGVTRELVGRNNDGRSDSAMVLNESVCVCLAAQQANVEWIGGGGINARNSER